MGTITNTVTLVPSGYTGLSNLTTSSSQPISYGYTDADSGTYAQLTLNTSTTGYLYYTFDTDDIPAGATISSITARCKSRVSNTSRVTNTVMQLYSGTTAKGSNTTFASTTASARSLSPGTGWTRADLNDLRLRIGGTGSSSTSSKYIRMYGADVTITYTVQTYNIVSSTNSGTIDPSGTTEVASGNSYTLRIIGLSSKPTVTDNNVDVTNQLTQSSEVTETLVPEWNTSGGFTVTNITNAYDNADSNNYADLMAPAGGSTCTLYLGMQSLDIPSDATITNVSCQATLQYNRNSSSSGFTASCRMYAGSTAKGSATTVVSAGGTDVAKTTFNLTVGSWTASEITSARFYLTATNNASGTQRHIYVYGVSFNVTYESDGVIYVYTLTNVQANHTIVVTAAASQKIYIKINGTWTQASKVYKKVNGSWVEQSDLTQVFDSGTNYIKG